MGWVNYMASEYLSKPGYHGQSDFRQGYTAHGGSSLNQQDVSLLIEEGESLTVEFKEKYTSRIDEDIVAFANTKGGAILLGVQDDGTVVGERLTNDMKGRINSLARNSQPPVQIDIMQIQEVIAIRVPEGGEKPYCCSSGYFRRLNGTTQKLNREELRVMFADNEAVPFEERSRREFTFDAVSRAKVLAFSKEAKIRLGSTTTADFLRSLNVADKNGVRNAGILFFGKEIKSHIPQAQLALLAFKGREKEHIYDRKDVLDDLLTQFNEAISFLKKHLNVRSEITGVDRNDIYEIPLDALREAVVNAIMHRDYSITGTQINIEVYEDRVEIVNPGGLPAGLPKKSLGKMSIRRNELVSDLFFRLRKVERIGMGIKKMRLLARQAGLDEPVFETNGFFSVVFRRPDPDTLFKAGWAAQKTTQMILDIIRKEPQITRKSLSEKTGLSEDGIKYHLAQLKKRKWIERIGADKGGRWVVVGEESEKD